MSLQSIHKIEIYQRGFRTEKEKKEMFMAKSVPDGS